MTHPELGLKKFFKVLTIQRGLISATLILPVIADLSTVLLELSGTVKGWQVLYRETDSTIIKFICRPYSYKLTVHIYFLFVPANDAFQFVTGTDLTTVLTSKMQMTHPELLKVLTVQLGLNAFKDF